MEKTEIKKARNGMGVFAKSQFHKGEIIFEVKGTLITCYEDDDLDERTRSNTFRFDEELYLSPTGEVAEYINHSCEPNSAVIKKDGKLFIVAIKDIGISEEVTFDYSTIIASDDDWVMNCNCGSEKCRQIIGQFIKLPKQKRMSYLNSGMVPEYIFK